MSEPAAAAPKKPLLGRWWARCCLALLLLLAAGYLARNLLVRKGMEAAVTEATGFPLAVDRFDLGVLRTRVEIDGMRLSNPPGFEDPRCLDVPRVVADVDLPSVFSERLHIEEIVVSVREVVVVRNAAGETNLDRLSALGKDGGEEAPEGKPGGAPAARKKPVRWRCDRLHLKMDRVVLLDWTKARNGKPKEEAWKVAIDEEFRNLRSPRQVMRLIVLKVLSKTPIRLAGVDADALRAGLDGVADKAGKALHKAAGGALGGALDGILGGDGRKKDEKAPPPPPKRKR